MGQISRISNIKIDGFRRLCDIDIKLAPFNVLIGANSIGKTSFLDIFSLLSASASGKLSEQLSAMGGMGSVLTKDGRDLISIEIEMPVEGDSPLSYELEIKRGGGGGYTISKEQLTQQRQGYQKPFFHITSQNGRTQYYDTENGRLTAPSWEYNDSETALSQVPKMYAQPEEFRKILEKTAKYHVLDVSNRAPVKLPQQLKPSVMPGTDGETLFSFLYELREKNRPRYDALIGMLKVAFSNFEDLYYPLVASGMISLQWKDRCFKEPLYMNEMSEGTLRFLWLIALLSSDSLPTILMIDEPEVSLHPEMLMLFVEALREASSRTQIIVATHSDRLVSFLEPSEIITMDIGDDGHAAMHNAAEEYDLEMWMQDYSLDEIWRMGRMGGRS